MPLQIDGFSYHFIDKSKFENTHWLSGKHDSFYSLLLSGVCIHPGRNFWTEKKSEPWVSYVHTWKNSRLWHLRTEWEGQREGEAKQKVGQDLDPAEKGLGEQWHLALSILFNNLWASFLNSPRLFRQKEIPKEGGTGEGWALNCWHMCSLWFPGLVKGRDNDWRG